MSEIMPLTIPVSEPISKMTGLMMSTASILWIKKIIGQRQLRYIMKERADKAYSDSPEDLFEIFYGQPHRNYTGQAAPGAENKGRTEKSADENGSKHNPYQGDHKSGPEPVQDSEQQAL